MEDDVQDEVWLFNGENGRFCSAVFSKKKDGLTWIKQHKLSGVLTLYPLNIGIYEWAIENNFFTPQKDHEFSASFIQKFTSASQEHYHFTDGEIE